jgi:hypothetical protein
MKIRVFWDVALCGHVEVDQRFTGAYCLHHQGDDWGSKLLWNVVILQQDYTALYPRQLSSLYSPSWKPETSHCWLILTFRRNILYLSSGLNISESLPGTDSCRPAHSRQVHWDNALIDGWNGKWKLEKGWDRMSEYRLLGPSLQGKQLGALMQ